MEGGCYLMNTKSVQIKKQKHLERDVSSLPLWAVNFKRLRKLNKWTLMELAKKTGITWGYIGRIERGEGSFAKKAQKKWAQIFGVNELEFTLPADSKEWELEHELMLLKSEARFFGIEKVKRFREWIQLFKGENNAEKKSVLSEPHKKVKKKE